MLLVGISNCGFSIPVMDWFSLVCKDVVCWFIGVTLLKFMEVNFGNVRFMLQPEVKTDVGVVGNR